MSQELTLENLYDKLELLGKTANKMEKYMASGLKVGGEEDEKKKQEAATKKADDEKKEEEKMQAKKAKYNAAIKAAEAEPDHEKKEAMVKSAMDELHDKKEAEHEDPKKHEATENEKEKDAQIASIILDKKNEIIAKILTANSIMNPQGLKAVEERLKTANITDITKEWNILAPAFEGSVAKAPEQDTQKFIGYFANVNPSDVDSSTLNASSPDSAFTAMSTKDLLEGKTA